MRPTSFRPVLVTVMLLATLAPGARAEGAGFTFHLPEGWRNVSPGVPAAELEGIPPAIVAAIRAQKPTFAAVSGANSSGGFDESVMATVIPGVEIETDATTKECLDSVIRGIEGTGAKVTGFEGSTLTFTGVKVRTASWTITKGRVRCTQLCYLLPGDGQTAIVAYSCAPEAFERHRADYEAAARQTKGLKAAGSARRAVFEKIGEGVAILAVVALVALLRRRPT